MSKRKWAKGELITSMDVLMEQEHVWINEKVYHAGWFQSWQLRNVYWQLKSGNLFKVVPAVYPATIVYDQKLDRYYCPICRAVISNGWQNYCHMCGTKLKIAKTIPNLKNYK